MLTTFKNKEITGILGVLPENEYNYDDEIDNYNFSKKQSMKLKKIMGYDKHRVVKENTTISDMCVFGIEYLFDKGYIKKEDIDALVLVTQSPDRFMPPTSNIIQGKLGLNNNIICMDINQGCCGFLVGLMQSFMLLDLYGINKVVLLNADILSRKVSKKDRNSYPISGDAATVTIIENSTDNNNVFMNLYTDGMNGNILTIPAGGFELPSSQQTAKLVDLGDGNLRSLDNLTMDGAEVFNFVQNKVPPMINEIMEYADIKKSDIDYYLFHQPNRFMLKKLADKLEISREKLPMNIVEKFGNSSGCTIPLNISLNIGDKALQDRYKCCLSGFGSGLSWSSIIMNIGNMKFNKIIISNY